MGGTRELWSERKADLISQYLSEPLAKCMAHEVPRSVVGRKYVTLIPSGLLQGESPVRKRSLDGIGRM